MATGAILALNVLTVRVIFERYAEELPRAFRASSGSLGGTRDLVLVALGLRGVAADMAMVDLLIYYGSHDEAADNWRAISGWDKDTGVYRDLLPLARRILGINPFFRYAILYASTALAFNESRDEEAVRLLKEALVQDPRYWAYSLNLSAIAYKKTKNYPELLKLLEQVYAYPECPTMLKNILGNIYLKTGQIGKAIAIFEWIAQYAPEEDYRQNMKEKLERISGLLRRRQ